VVPRLSCGGRTTANGTQHKKTTGSFQSHPHNHEKMQRPTYGYVLSLVLRRMPTAASVAVAVIDN